MQFAKKDLAKILDIMAQDATVLVPMNVQGNSKFAPWGAQGELDFAAQNTLLPPKDSLFPQTEKMYRFEMDGAKVAKLEELNESRPTVLFGLKGCDMQSILCMDDVFLTKGYEDAFYKNKRDQLLTVCVNCPAAAKECFCDSMGGSPNGNAAADIQLFDLGDRYQVKAQSAKGEKAVSAWQPYLSDGEENPKEIACETKVDMTGVPEKLAAMFEDPIWEEVSRKCLGCGICTYVCPSCYCFDIDSENTGTSGTKFRCWDSCMFSEYTRMAGGHNPRPSKKERVRNRFLHKLQYFNERYGKNLCVGCGRCVAKCPVNLDIVNFIDQVKEGFGHE